MANEEEHILCCVLQQHKSTHTHTRALLAVNKTHSYTHSQANTIYRLWQVFAFHQKFRVDSRHELCASKWCCPTTTWLRYALNWYTFVRRINSDEKLKQFKWTCFPTSSSRLAKRSHLLPFILALFIFTYSRVIKVQIHLVLHMHNCTWYTIDEGKSFARIALANPI